MVGRKRLQTAMDQYRERAGDDVDFTIRWKPFRYITLLLHYMPVRRTILNDTLNHGAVLAVQAEPGPTPG